MDCRLAFGNSPLPRKQVKLLRQELNTEHGRVGRWIGAVAAPILLGASVLDQFRATGGWTREPRTLIERRNWTTQASDTP